MAKKAKTKKVSKKKSAKKLTKKVKKSAKITKKSMTNSRALDLLATDMNTICGFMDLIRKTNVVLLDTFKEVTKIIAEIHHAVGANKTVAKPDATEEKSPDNPDETKQPTLFDTVDIPEPKEKTGKSVVTKDDVLGALKQVNTVHGINVAKEILAKFKVKRLSDIKETDYSALFEACRNQDTKSQAPTTHADFL